MIQRQFELDDMQRTINEYGDNAAVAAAQAALASKRKSVADQNKAIADLRLTQAATNRQFAENKPSMRNCGATWRTACAKSHRFTWTASSKLLS